MANPIDVNLTKDSWTKVATNVLQGFVWIRHTKPAIYLHTYRLTGEAAPVSRSEGMPLPQPGYPILSASSVDVYIWCDLEEGVVRVDA